MALKLRATNRPENINNTERLTHCWFCSFDGIENEEKHRIVPTFNTLIHSLLEYRLNTNNIKM